MEEDGSRQVRRRELGTVDCFPTPNSHNEAQAKGAPHYYTAELAPSSLPEATPFTVGDNHTYNGYWNSPLDPTKNYLIYFQATSNFRGVRTIKMLTQSSHCFYVLPILTVYLDLLLPNEVIQYIYALFGWFWVDCFPLVNLILINFPSLLSETKEQHSKLFPF